MLWLTLYNVEKTLTNVTWISLDASQSINSSGVSHSDGSCVLGRIHSDVSSNIPKKVYHIVTDNFVNLLHISYAWLYKTECWGRKFHAFSFNSHRNCKIFMTNFNFIFDTICVPYIFRKSIFGWNCDHDMPLCDTPLLEDTPLCDTPDEFYLYVHAWMAHRGAALNFFQVGVSGPDLWSVGLEKFLPPKEGSCELKISKFGGLKAEIWAKLRL